MMMLKNWWQVLAVALMATTTTSTLAFTPVTNKLQPISSCSTQQFLAKPSGAFFNPVPDDGDDDNNENNNNKPEDKDDTQLDIDQSLEKLMKDRNSPSLASQPSTINGVPTSQAGVGFGTSKSTTNNNQKNNQKTPKPYIGIGEPDQPINDVTKPEYDDQGYTLYTDEQTGEKARVFKALVDYPCEFTMKVVGANEGTFVEEILQVVADSCNIDDATGIKHKTRSMGKWISVTVEAPVENAEMLYQLYENVDKDPRVKFKF